MIFAAAEKEPAMFLFLSEKDIQDMREGRTKFVDERATKGFAFQKVILAVVKTDQDAIALLQGHAAPEVMANPGLTEKQAGEEQCPRCGAILQKGSLFECLCVVCWATEAKRLRTQSN